ncbi:MAG: SDR family oxidoreductase [Acidimicrobiales bacterium]
MRDPSLHERVIVVTGSSRGIGTGIGTAIIDADGAVVGVSRSGDALPAAAADRFRSVAVDITLREAPELAFERAIEEFGRVDGLVNNAGLHRSAHCWEQSDDDFDDMYDVNVTAPFRFSQYFARRWIDSGTPGVIVNICSVESEVGWKDPPQAVYASTKGALLGLTRVLGYDLAAHGIRAVAVGPGAIDTGMAAANKAETEARIPLGNRYGTPSDIGSATVFLLSDAARYVTGEILYVDGGYRLP